MTHLVDRLADLRKHLDHLKALRPKVTNAGLLRTDLSLHNDVLFSLFTVAQLLIDVSGELCSRRAIRFDDYTEAVRNLVRVEGFTPELVAELVPIPGFRNVLVHEYAELDYDVVFRALGNLAPVEEFVRIAARAA